MGLAQKAPLDKQAQGQHQKNALKSSSGCLENSSKLDGITYEIVAAQDGRECIMATGNTQPRKEMLSGAGFRRNTQRKIWWKYADAA